MKTKKELPSAAGAIMTLLLLVVIYLAGIGIAAWISGSPIVAVFWPIALVYHLAILGLYVFVFGGITIAVLHAFYRLFERLVEWIRK